MENYFWNTEEHEEKTIYLLVIYDIVSNKRRNAFAKTMNGYGFRVQKSAFEAMVTKALYRKLLKEIPMMIDATEYKLRGTGEVSLFGMNEQIKNEEVLII